MGSRREGAHGKSGVTAPQEIVNMPAAKDTAKPSSRKPPLSVASQTKVTDSDAVKKSAAPKPSKKPPVDNSKQITLNPEERYRMIAVAAYYRAEKRGFIGGDPAQDWVDAEAEVERLIGKSQGIAEG